MNFAEVFLIGVGLSMDAFAVSVCKGLCMTKINKVNTFVLAFFFGIFQALMPLLGYFLGDLLYNYFKNFGGIIAFILLLIVGGKMAWDGFSERKEAVACDILDEKLDLREVFFLAVATSIDAFAVGITFVVIEANILSSITIIGITTFVLSIIGVIIGNIIGARIRTQARIIGGIILILIGIKILLGY